MRVTFEPIVLHLAAFPAITQDVAQDHPIFDSGLIERMKLGEKNLKGGISLTAYVLKSDNKREQVFIFASGNKGGSSVFVYKIQTNNLQSGLTKATQDL